MSRRVPCRWLETGMTTGLEGRAMAGLPSGLRSPVQARSHRLAALLAAMALLFAAPPITSADAGEALAAATFASIANPCSAGETWIKPIRIVQLADGGSIDIYDKGGLIASTPQPPATFDPLSASDEDLATYGFPQRPSAANDLAQWQDEMSLWRPTKDIGECQTARRATHYQNPIWSGYDADSSSSTYYRAVQGDYAQPSKHSTSCTPNEEVSWVGLGGYHTARLIQTGTGINTSGGYYAWYEYLNASGGIPITVLPSVTVHAGDSIHLYVVHQTSGSGQTTFYVADNTTGTSQSKIINLGSSYYDGYSAEFIDERPSYIYGPTNLTNFYRVNWTNTKVYPYTGTWYTLNRPGFRGDSADWISSGLSARL